MKLASRMSEIEPFVFARQNTLRDQLIERGVDVIDMSVGDPDIPTPWHIINRLTEAAKKKENHRYPPYNGTLGFRRAVADYYGKRFNVTLDPLSQVMTVIGSKEGISHLIWALVGPGQYALLPDPAYPIYDTQVKLAGGDVYKMPLLAENGFLPRFEDIPVDVARKASLMILNYPNNPTGGVADLRFFQEAVEFCGNYDIVLCHDAAYVDIAFDGLKPPSVLEVFRGQSGSKMADSRDLIVESYSLSKPFNMTGWRIGAMVGSPVVLKEALGVIKSNTDSGQFNAIQEAGESALLENPEKVIESNVSLYKERRDIMVEALNHLGEGSGKRGPGKVKVLPPRGTFYLWVRVPDEDTSESFAAKCLEETGILLTPGTAYGVYGTGYVRMSLSVPTERVLEAARRLKEWGKS